MKKNYLFKAAIILLGMYFSQEELLAQCSAPTFAETVIEGSTCLSNGKVTVTSTTDGEGVALQYALYNAANSSVVKGYQSSNEIVDVAGGNYTLRVRYQCAEGYSTDYTKSINVPGSYISPIISSINYQRSAQCLNGRFEVLVSGGSGPFTYSIVPSLTSAHPLPIEEYIYPPQSSNIFDSMAAGTYYVRIMDACGGYDTKVATVSSVATTDPMTTFRFSLQYRPCDSVLLNFILTPGTNYVPETADTIRKVWVTFPDGSTDTVIYDIGTAYTHKILIPLTKLGTVDPSLSFPDNIGGTWPKTFTFNYLDACGNVFTATRTTNKPDYKPVLQRVLASSTCSTIAYTLRMVDSANHESDMTPYFVINDNTFLSSDGGATWGLAGPSGTGFQDNTKLFDLPYDTPLDVKIAYCGDTHTVSGTTPVIDPLVAKVGQNNETACEGRVSLRFHAFRGRGPVAVEMVSGPEGQGPIVGSLNISTSPQTFLAARNILPGEYVFKFSEPCGLEVYDTFNATITYPHVDVSYSFPCGSTDLIVKMAGYSNYTYTWAMPTTATAPYSSTSTNSVMYTGQYRAHIVRASDLGSVTIPIQSNGDSIKITSASIASIPDGEYYVCVFKNYNYPTAACDTVYLPWTKNGDFISLSSTQTFSPCDGTTDGGAVIANATGGSGTFTYNLYENSVAIENLIAGPQTHNIFSSLTTSGNYILTVNDDCGRGT